MERNLEIKIKLSPAVKNGVTNTIKLESWETETEVAIKSEKLEIFWQAETEFKEEIVLILDINNKKSMVS